MREIVEGLLTRFWGQVHRHERCACHGRKGVGRIIVTLFSYQDLEPKTSSDKSLLGRPLFLRLILSMLGVHPLSFPLRNKIANKKHLERYLLREVFIIEKYFLLKHLIFKLLFSAASKNCFESYQ